MSSRRDLWPLILFCKRFIAIQNVSKCDLFGFRDCVVSGQNHKGLMNHVTHQCWVWFMPPTRLYLLRKILAAFSLHMYAGRSRGICFCWWVFQVLHIQLQLWKLNGDDWSIFPWNSAEFKKGRGPIPFSVVLACALSPDGRSHHLHAQITSTVPVGLVSTQIVNPCRCRTELFTDKTPSHVLEQNVGESFEQGAIISCAQCGGDPVVNMTTLTFSSSSLASKRKCKPQK